MGKFDAEKYEQAKEVAHNYFQKNKKVHSPALGDVRLNSDGFNHLIYEDKKHKKKRDWKNQVKRFHLTAHIKRVLKGMDFYQEYTEQYDPFTVKHHGKKQVVNKLVAYYGFIAVIDNKIRIKIVVRKVGNANPQFWSVIPFWKSQHYKGIKMLDISTGDLETD